MKKIIAALFFNSVLFAGAQTINTTYAEKLGFPKGAKVIILHVDDAGMSYDSNEGAINSITKGVANSCSVMMPCGWVPGFVHYLKENPGIDAGLHLTLTSEWKDYRWVPLSGKDKVPGLVDKEGALWSSVDSVVKNATADEVEAEITAQAERAKAMGFTPTHFDSHMGTLFASPLFFERYIKLGITYHTPVMVPAGHATIILQQMNAPDALVNMMRAAGKQLWDAGLPVLDDLHNTSYDWHLPQNLQPTDKNLQKNKTAFYIEELKKLQPGVTMVIMHCTQPSPIFEKISSSGTVRKSDMLAMMDPELKKFIQKEGIMLTTWRELMERRSKVN